MTSSGLGTSGIVAIPIPAGGAAGEVLTKQSGDNYDFDWDPNSATAVDAGTINNTILRWNGATPAWEEFTAFLLPLADGTVDQIMTTDGAGTLSFVDPGAGGGLLSAEYRFSTSTVAADPGSGRFRFDTAAYSTVTEIFIDDETSNGVDISNLLTLVGLGDRLYFQVKSEADKFVVFDVTGPSVDNGGWFTIPVTEVVSGDFFANNDRCLMIWSVGGSDISLDGLTDVTITSVATNDRLVKSTGDWINQQPNAQRDFFEKMGTRVLVQSDFLELPPIGSAGLQVEGLIGVVASGGFVSVPTTGYDFTNHPGVWGLNTGTTSTAGRVFLLSQFPGGIFVGVGGITRHGCWYQSPAVASIAANRYVLRSGFSAITLPNTLAQGITFEAQDDENGGRWQAICAAASVETSVDTGVAVGTSTYFFLEFEVNAAGTSVEFFIDGASVATIVTNIPSGTGFRHFISEHIMKLTGVLNRASYVDAYYFYQEITR